MSSITRPPNSALASDSAAAFSPKRPWVRLVVAVLVTGFAVSAVFGMVFAVAEFRRSMVAQEIEDRLRAVPGVTAAEASYSYEPLSTGRVFTIELQVSADADSAEVSAALVASQERWHDSPLADDAVSTGVMLTAADAVDPSAEGSTLSFADWALPAEETGQQVAY